MSSSKRSVQNASKNLPEVSHNNLKAAGAGPGVIVAAMEVPPQNAAIMSLGVFSEPPKGFCIEYHLESPEPHLASEVTIHPALTGGDHYLLQIANQSSQTIWAEIRQI